GIRRTRKGMCHLCDGPQLPQFVGEVGMLVGECRDVWRATAPPLVVEPIEQGRQALVAVGHERLSYPQITPIPQISKQMIFCFEMWVIGVICGSMFLLFGSARQCVL